MPKAKLMNKGYTERRGTQAEPQGSELKYIHDKITGINAKTIIFFAFHLYTKKINKTEDTENNTTDTTTEIETEEETVPQNKSEEEKEDNESSIVVDNETGFISQKSKDGKDLKALELPGLWNGAMADWITVFVEVPLETFNPVKVINDLLRPEHRQIFYFILIFLLILHLN